MLNRLERTFGAEFELVITNNGGRRGLALALQAAGINAQVSGYTHTTTPHWKLTTDCTIATHGRGEGCELVSPILKGAQGFADLKTVCEVLNAFGVWSNKSCSNHVHIQADDLSLKQLKNVMKASLKYEWVIDRFVAKSRRAGNKWAAPIARHFGRTQADVEDNFSMIDSAADINALQAILNPRNNGLNNGSRYHKWNFAHLVSRGTLENRQHNATQDFEKISAWLNLQMAFLQGFADTRLRASKITHRPQANAAHHQTAGNLTLDKGIRRLFKYICLEDGTIDKDLRKYYQKRAKDLASAEAATMAAA